MADVTVAVVTHDSAADLPALLASLEAGMAGVPYALAVADNASGDGTPEVARRLRPDATVLELGRNAGYAAGVNAAAAAVPSARAVLVLNPDLTLHPGAGAALLAALDEPGTGIAVPRLVNSDGSLATSLRREPTVLRAWGEALLGGRRAGRHDRLGEMVVDPSAYQRPGRPAWATGAAMLVSRSCLAAVGPFDESFFLYSEETDFALRAAEAGFALRYVPAAGAMHVGGESGTSPPLYALLTRNRLRLFARRHGRAATAAFWAGLVVGEALRAPRHAAHRRALRALVDPRTPLPGGVMHTA